MMVCRTAALRKIGRMVAGSLLLAALAGCQILNAVTQPLDLYTVTPKSTFDPNLPDVFWQLTVEEPVAAGNLNTSRIAIAMTPTSSDYYSKTAWTDRLPLMVQTRMLDSFENTHKIVAVSRDSVGLRPNYVLPPGLRNFGAICFYGGAALAPVRRGRQP